MTVREFLLERARGCGLRMKEEYADFIRLSPIGIFPPPNIPKLSSDISRYGFSFRPSLRPGELIVYAPPEGFDADMTLLKAKESEHVFKVPVELISHLPEWRPPHPGEAPPTVRVNPPTPRTIWPPPELRESITVARVADRAGMRRSYGKIWPKVGSPLKKQLRERIKAFKQVGNLLVVKNTNRQGEGAVRLYGYYVPTEHYFQLASRAVSGWGEADAAYSEAVTAMREGG